MPVGNFFWTDNLICAHGLQIFLHGLCTGYTRLFMWKRQIIRNIFAREVTNVKTFAINYFFLRCKFKHKRSFSRQTMRLTASYRSTALRRYAILCWIKFFAYQFYKQLFSLDNVSCSMFLFFRCFIKFFDFFFCCFCGLQYACGLGSDANMPI